MIWGLGVLPADVPPKYDHVLQQLYSLSWSASLEIQACDSEGCTQIVRRVLEVDATRALPLVYRHMPGLILGSGDACEVSDAAHVPRREQRAQEVQPLELPVLCRHQFLSITSVQHDRHAAKGGEAGTGKDGVQVSVLRAVCIRGGVS